MKIPGGSVRGSADGSGGGAITIGSGKSTLESPHIHTTVSVSKDGNLSGAHTTVSVGGQSIVLDKK